MAVVTDVDLGSGALQLEVSPLVFADSGEDWAPGVHLFAFAVGHGGQQTETVATVVVPKGKVKKALKLSAAGMRAYMVAGRGTPPAGSGSDPSTAPTGTSAGRRSWPG